MLLFDVQKIFNDHFAEALLFIIRNKRNEINNTTSTQNMNIYLFDFTHQTNQPVEYVNAFAFDF